MARPRAPLATRLGVLASVCGLVVASIRIVVEDDWVVLMTWVALTVALVGAVVAVVAWFWPRKVICGRCGRCVPEAFLESIDGAGDGGILNAHNTNPLIACQHCLYGTE